MDTAFAERIDSLDPLRADASVQNLRAMNAAGDVTSLVGALCLLVPSSEQIKRFTLGDCAAALRDLGIFLGSIKRHGAEPVTLVPQIERPLLLLAERTGMVPRDTFYHYGPWNPSGPRQRMYTGDALEDVLICSLRLAVPDVEFAVAILEDMLEVPPDDAAFACLCRQATRHIAGMVHAVDLVMHNLTPEYFAQIMRPYFEGVALGGRTFHGPAAAHMPLYLVDHLLWSSDCSDELYLGFQHETAPYSLPRWRELFRRQVGQPSLTTRVLASLRAVSSDPGEALLESAQALCGMFHALIRFRGRHFVLVQGAYREDIRLYSVGSGGASVELVAHILQLTQQYATLVTQNRSATRAGHI